MRTLRTVSIESALAPPALLTALERAAGGWSAALIPADLRRRGILGASLRRRGARFILRLRRTRRVVAPVIVAGRVEAIAGGSRLRAELRPSRTWLWFPAIGTMLLLMQVALSPPRGMAMVGYALVLGVLWAVNLLAASIPVGADPVTEAAALERLLREAAGPLAAPQPAV